MLKSNSYLKVDIDVAAQRAYADPNRKRSEDLPTVEAQKADMIKRAKGPCKKSNIFFSSSVTLAFKLT